MTSTVTSQSTAAARGISNKRHSIKVPCERCCFLLLVQFANARFLFLLHRLLTADWRSRVQDLFSSDSFRNYPPAADSDQLIAKPASSREWISKVESMFKLPEEASAEKNKPDGKGGATLPQSAMSTNAGSNNNNNNNKQTHRAIASSPPPPPPSQASAAATTTVSVATATAASPVEGMSVEERKRLKLLRRQQKREIVEKMRQQLEKLTLERQQLKQAINDEQSKRKQLEDELNGEKGKRMQSETLQTRLEQQLQNQQQQYDKRVQELLQKLDQVRHRCLILLVSGKLPHNK